MSHARKEDEVTGAYLRRAKGYEVTETKEEFNLDDQGKLRLTRKTEKTRHVPGDARAAEFWLINRQPDKWRHPRAMGQRAVPEGETGVVEMPVAIEPQPPEGPGHA